VNFFLFEKNRIENKGVKSYWLIFKEKGPFPCNPPLIVCDNHDDADESDD